MHFDDFKQQFGFESQGVYSVCSAHPMVLRAAMRIAGRHRTPLLIESTVNQVNHQGGYTGMRPADFRNFVDQLARSENFPPARIILGGDHLGPYPWRSLPAEEAMQHALQLVEETVHAGYRKLHLDPSMACKGDPSPLPVEVIAERTAQMAAVAEQTARHNEARKTLFYVVGTEVPPPGGAQEEHTVAITPPEQLEETVAALRLAFKKYDLEFAWERVIAIVVQPGVEFSNASVVNYVPYQARRLKEKQTSLGGIVYEAHSTDYQLPDSLHQLVGDGFAILKVGPWLTFSYREGIWGLAHIEAALQEAGKIQKPSNIHQVLLNTMSENPQFWQSYARDHLEQIFGLSDRVRYYWNHEPVMHAVKQLMVNLKNVTVPPGLFSQYFPDLYPALRAGTIKPQPEALLIEKICRVLNYYHRAVQ